MTQQLVSNSNHSEKNRLTPLIVFLSGLRHITQKPLSSEYEEITLSK